MFWFESVIPSFLGFSGDVFVNNSFGILVPFDMFGVVTGSKVDIIVFVAEEFAVVARINLVLISSLIEVVSFWMFTKIEDVPILGECIVVGPEL